MWHLSTQTIVAAVAVSVCTTPRQPLQSFAPVSRVLESRRELLTRS